MGLGSNDLLPIYPNNKSKHAMRRGVLRSHIDHEVNGIGLLCWLFLELHRVFGYPAS